LPYLAIGIDHFPFFTTARNPPMNRLYPLAIAAAMVLGCRTPTPTFDPFQGPPRIPPPGTGQVGQVAPPDSYYSAPTSVPATAPARYVPRDGSYQFRSGSVERDDAARFAGGTGARGQGSGASEEQAEQTSGVTTADYEQDATDRDARQGNVRQAADWEQEPAAKPARYDARIRVVEPPAKTAEATPGEAPREPARFQPDGAVTEISDLPKDRAASTAPKPRATIRAASDRSPTRIAAGEEEEKGPVTSRFATTRSTPGPSGGSRQFGYDPEYRSLQGRLEFSESESRWKLRYIPIDGQTDKYGGSVVLSDSPQLDGFEPGDFVTVEGTVGKKDPRSRGFAPNYQLDRILRTQ
jgi:hypothetical protein